MTLVTLDPQKISGPSGIQLVLRDPKTHFPPKGPLYNI